MSDVMHSPTKHAEELADAVLRAAGSGLRNYSMPSGRALILAAAQRGIDAARDDLVKALQAVADDAVHVMHGESVIRDKTRALVDETLSRALGKE